MPQHIRAEDEPAGAGRPGRADRPAWLRRDWRSLRRWQRPRIAAAGITAVAAAAALVAANGMAGAGAAIAGTAWAGTSWATWWSVPAIAAGSLLAGLIVGSYVRAPIGAEATLCDTRWPVLGLAGLALGTSPGPDSLLAYLFSWAAPALLGAVIQPAVSLAFLALLGWALRLRLDLERAALAPDDGAPFGAVSCPTCRPLFPPARGTGDSGGDALHQIGAHTVRSTTRRR